MNLILLTAENISKNFGGKPLLHQISLTVAEGDKIGLIGVNGTGKSTFLKMIAGIEPPDEGNIAKINGIRVGYLPQNPVFLSHASILEQVRSVVPSAREFECKSILTRLGITDFEKDVSLLSGGQKKRVALAAALSQDADLLVLDEPTNHLDGDTVAWLENYLMHIRGSLLMVTHDRYFLERAVNEIIELEGGSIYSYPANFSRYLELKEQREEMNAASERKRQTLLKKELEWIRRGARARGTKARFRVDRYEELKNQSGPEEAQRLELSALSSRLGKKIIEADGISKGYEGKTLFEDFTYHFLRNDRLGIVGPNGCGKSTLFKVLLGKVLPDSGTVSIGETVKIGYFSQESEEMDLSLRVIDYIRNTSDRISTPDGTFSASQMLERFLFPSELQYTEIGRLSGGERRRLFLLKILMDAPNILFLDEPTNDLDIQTLSILEDYLETFPGAVAAVSHDRYFLDKIADHLFAFEDRRLVPYLGGYSEYLENRPEPQETAIKKEKKAPPAREKKQKLKFTFKEQREYEEIDGTIAAIEAKISSLQEKIQLEASNFEKLQELLSEKETQEKLLEEKTERWVYLNDLAEQIEAQK